MCNFVNQMSRITPLWLMNYISQMRYNWKSEIKKVRIIGHKMSPCLAITNSVVMLLAVSYILHRANESIKTFWIFFKLDVCLNRFLTICSCSQFDHCFVFWYIAKTTTNRSEICSHPRWQKRVHEVARIHFLFANVSLWAIRLTTCTYNSRKVYALDDASYVHIETTERSKLQGKYSTKIMKKEEVGRKE